MIGEKMAGNSPGSATPMDSSKAGLFRTKAFSLKRSPQPRRGDPFQQRRTSGMLLSTKRCTAALASLTEKGQKSHLWSMTRPREDFEITPDILLRAYSIGLFPMAESAEDKNLFWIEPEARGVFPLDRMIISKKLARTIRSDRFEIR